MAERVHPTSDSPPPAASSVNSGDPVPPPSQNPPPRTYVIQLPKDQVYRVPPPENAARFKLYTRQSNHHCRCRRFLCCTLLIVTLLLLLSAIASAVFFLILQPVSPRYSILAIAINGTNPTSLSTNNSISPQFNVTVRAENPNGKIGVYHEKNSNITVYFLDVMLCEGALPAFFQPSRNVAVVAAKLKGSGIKLSRSVQKAMKDSEKQGKVRLKVDLRAPVKLKVYSVKTWTITTKVSCNIWVKKLTAETKTMVVENCDHSVKLW